MARPSVHLGNVAEFNSPSLTSLGRLPEVRIAACDEYASMAPFYGPNPGLVVIPNARQDSLDRWAELQVAAMGWESFNPRSWSGPSLELSERLSVAPEFRHSLRDAGDVIAWGETPSFRSLVESTGASSLLSTRMDAPQVLDSKSKANTVFATAAKALGHPSWLAVPSQWVVDSDKDLPAALIQGLESGRPLILKSDCGVGGTGCVRLQLSDMATTKEVDNFVKELQATDPFVLTPPILVQHYRQRSDTDGDLTIDLQIDAAGDCRVIGAARMLVDDLHYVGCVTLEDAHPIVEKMKSFGLEVGAIAADHGYRGWFDIDFIQTSGLDLVPLEINARGTGPTVPMVIRDLWAQPSARSVYVATHDMVQVPRTWTDAPSALSRTYERLSFGSNVVPTLTAGLDSASPYIGVAVGGDSPDDAYRRLAALAGAIAQP
jgi:hypothetical protein